MIKKSIIVGIIVLIIALAGLMFFLNITGNVIMDSSANQEEIKNDYFKIDNSSDGEENIKNVQNIIRQG